MIPSWWTAAIEQRGRRMGILHACLPRGEHYRLVETGIPTGNA